MNHEMTLANLLRRLGSHLSRRRYRQFLVLMGMIFVSAFAEVVSLGAVLPFIGILTAPDLVFNHPLVSDAVLALGITSADQLVLPLTVAFVLAALIAGAIRILVLWASTRIAYASGADLGIESYRRTLYQPYKMHVSRNSSSVISGITNKINNVVAFVLLPLLTLVSATVLLVAIIIVLIVIDPMVASVAAVTFGTSYVLISWISRQRLNRNSKRIAYEQTQVIKALQEGLGGIRDVLLDGTQPVFCDTYRQADQPLRRAQGNNIFIGGSPRFIMETLGMVLIAALAYALSKQVGGIATALPVLGALAVGAQRLLPALQQIYNSWASIAGNHASLVDVIELLDQSLVAELVQPAAEPLLLKKDIQFKSVRFRYTNDDPWVLDNLDLTIAKGTRVGFVGSTGSGKSTMLDLLMGLLVPTEGEFLVDGQPINGKRAREWQRSIAHVPQSIYLADSTLAENVAFGVAPENIDLDRVRQATRKAQIENFIENSPEGYQAYVGERGVQLSGGQRQRIGIARALYKQASVLVFDEATSALDTTTEQSVMDAIEGLSSDLTILLIAHRLTTLQRCDTIVELEQGRVVSQGTYEQLLECSPSFYKMHQQEPS
ncbi:ABC transporter ATP-binding protein/permease [Gammaproteobacteria bacterium]|nr:ABC transporter ATP-binding protein/permease [Gammaproteobacteria bacterium]